MLKNIICILLYIMSFQLLYGESYKKLYPDDTLKLRIINLPSIEDTSYFRVIEKGKSVTMHSGRVYLKEGENVGEHSSENYEELIIIFKGYGEIENSNKERFKIKEGQVIYIPPNSTHNVFNTGTGPLIYIYIVSKAQ